MGKYAYCSDENVVCSSQTGRVRRTRARMCLCVCAGLGVCPVCENCGAWCRVLVRGCADVLPRWPPHCACVCLVAPDRLSAGRHPGDQVPVSVRRLAAEGELLRAPVQRPVRTLLPPSAGVPFPTRVCASG